MEDVSSNTRSCIFASASVSNSGRSSGSVGTRSSLLPTTTNTALSGAHSTQAGTHFS